MGKPRSRKVSLVCYEKPVEDVLNRAIRWAYILHDRDEYIDQEGEVKKKEPHYHVYLEFANPRYFESVGKEYGIASNLVNFVHNTNATLAYFTHRTSKAMSDGKVLYAPEEVVYNEELQFDFSKIIESGVTFQWLTIFRAPSLEDAIEVYKHEGGSLDNLQNFKNFASTYISLQMYWQGEGCKSRTLR